MIRLLFAVVCAVALGGCKGSEARIPIDPFYGQTKIPPPGTGQMSRRPAVDPYYPHQAATAPQGIPQASEGLAATSEAATGAASPPRPAEANTASPPAGQLAGQPKGDQIEIPGAARRSIPIGSEATVASPSSLAASPPSRPAAAASNAAASPGPPKAPERIVQTIAPRGDDVARQGPAVYPPPTVTRGGAASAAGGAVDIMDLPPVGGGAEVRREDRVELASAIAPVSKPKAAAAAVAEEPLAGNARKKPDPLGDYGYSTDYRRLRGRLEYLEKEQCWKLRYIPIDGATDQYGGSVVLEQSGALAGFRRGDLVEVRGELSARAAEGKDFAPAYQVADIRALGN
ncbi:MAG: hypothetical protein ACOX1P_15080 [Thermoguttaceae bacterium]|jgi:hypothetical protein